MKPKLTLLLNNKYAQKMGSKSVSNNKS